MRLNGYILFFLGGGGPGFEDDASLVHSFGMCAFCKLPKARLQQPRPNPRPRPRLWPVIQLKKKRKQSNMVGQLKNASLKLQKVQQGEVKVSEAEMEELEAKQKFWSEYCGLSHFDDKKGEMLEAFSFDKTCTKWATRTKEISQETYQNASGSDGYLSSSLACIHFFEVFFFPTGVGVTLNKSTPTEDSKWLSRRIWTWRRIRNSFKLFWTVFRVMIFRMKIFQGKRP